MKNKRILFVFMLLLSTLCITSCATQTIPQSKSNINLVNSITYININALQAKQEIKGTEYFVPISYVNNNKQILVGDQTTIPLSDYEMINDISKLGKLNKVSVKPMFSSDTLSDNEHILQENVIATNGEWNLFPDKVTYTKYDLDNQPNIKKWNDYFEQQLLTHNSENSDIIITETWDFEWSGKKATIVNASNVLLTGGDSIIYGPSLKYDGQAPQLLKGCVMYSFSALFTASNETVIIYNMVQKIADIPLNDDLDGISFLPSNNQETFQQIYSMALLSKNNKHVSVPIFNNAGGELLIRDFIYMPTFVLCDIDGDKKSELVCYIKRTSSAMSVCQVYKLKNGKPEKVFSIIPN